MILIYTDGACSGNPGLGGWGAVIIEKNKDAKFINGGENNTTNNRMELLSVIVALEKLKKDKLNVTIYSDSKYVVDSVEKGWVLSWEKNNFSKKKNPDLWIRFLKVYRKHSVKFIWIKGHSSVKENEKCDRLAVSAALSENLSVDVWYEKNENNNTLF